MSWSDVVKGSIKPSSFCPLALSLFSLGCLLCFRYAISVILFFSLRFSLGCFSLTVNTSGSDSLEKIVSEMACNMLISTFLLSALYTNLSLITNLFYLCFVY